MTAPTAAERDEWIAGLAIGDPVLLVPDSRWDRQHVAEVRGFTTIPGAVRNTECVYVGAHWEPVTWKRLDRRTMAGEGWTAEPT